jgi:hypothetical protein
MKQTFTLFFIGFLCFSANAIAQCTSPSSNYDLIVVSNVTIAPQTTAYMQGYVCNGGVLTDSAYCCTRFLNIDSGGVVMVGPASYGQAFVKNGGTFNGQNSSSNWAVFYEAGANVINHVGNSQQCPQITFTANNCIMGFTPTDSPKPNVSLVETNLMFAFSSAVSDVTVEVFDVAGNVVRSGKVNQTSVHSMNLAGLAGGMYVYRVTQGTEVISSDKIVLP